MYNNPITFLRESSVFTRSASALTIFFFLFTFYSPGVLAVKEAIEQEQAKTQFQAKGKTDDEKLSFTLQSIKEHVAERKTRLKERVATESSLWQDFLNLFGLSDLTAEDLDRLQSMAEQAEQLHHNTLQSFKQTEQQLTAKGMPEPILQRHADTVAKYNAEYRRFRETVHQVREAGSLQDQARAMEQLDGFLKERRFKKPHQPLDPDRLPFATPKAGDTREPVTDQEGINELMGAGENPGVVNRVVNGLVSPAYAQAEGSPGPDDLEPTLDAQITPQIQALADQLGNDPVDIYTWVHNNIEFLPTYGSVQGSGMTLQARRGNAFDTASLLIALLRASGTPARYVLGTVEIPVQNVQNWLGGVPTPEMAQEILGQSGVPNTALVSGGQIAAIRMEHVWVEAWVDFNPSRGFRNVQGDSWVPLDASYKQHTFDSGTNLAGNVPFDISTLADNALEGAEVDPQTGAITGMDQSLIRGFLADYRQQADDYIDSNATGSSVSDIFGGETIINRARQPLAAGLPYKLVARSQAVASLPSGLRHAARITVYNSRSGDFFGGFGSLFDSVAFQYTIDLPTLNTRRLGLTYEPATESDAQTLESFQSGEGSSIPLSLIDVRPIITLDGEPVAQGPSTGMGMVQPVGVTLLNGPDSTPVRFEVTTGDESVFGINGNGITLPVVEDRLARVPSDTAAENLHQVALHYWMEYDLANEAIAAGNDADIIRLPSVGLFSSPLTVSYFFGVPRSGVYQSRIMDVKRSLLGVVAPTNEQKKLIAEQSGIQGSYLEGSVFDQLFDNGVGSGISAVQLIMDSNLFGIPLHHVTGDNISEVLPLLSVGSDVKTDISNAVNAGKTVLVPEEELTRAAWSGTGYIVRDADTGAGAYLISGGLNGGGDVDCEPNLVPLVVAIVAVIIIAALLIYFWPVITGALAGASAGVPVAARAMIAAFAALFAFSPAYAAAAPDFDQCLDEWEANRDECFASWSGTPNLRACLEWANDQLTLCKKGCPGFPFNPPF